MRFSDVLSSFIVFKCLNESMAFYFAYFLTFLSCHFTFFPGRFGKVNNVFAIEREQEILSETALPSSFVIFNFLLKSLKVIFGHAIKLSSKIYCMFMPLIKTDNAAKFIDGL